MDNGNDRALFLLDTQGNIPPWTPAPRPSAATPRRKSSAGTFHFYSSTELDAGMPAKALRTALAKGRLREQGVRRIKLVRLAGPR